MSDPTPANRKKTIGISALCVAVGLYFMLVGLGLLPVPGGPRNLHAPHWVVLLAGLVFFLGGVAVLMQVVGRANASGDLPSDTPFWLRVAQYLIGVAIFASFALVGSWIAIGGDARQFSGGVPIVNQPTNVTIARAVFGFGAIICWLATIGFAVSGARKLFGRRK